jgi:signal transduction histidine kinase
LCNEVKSSTITAEDSLLHKVYLSLDASDYNEAGLLINQIYRSQKSLTRLQQYYLHCFQAEVMYYHALFGIGKQSTLEALHIAEELHNDTLIGNCYNFLGLFTMNENSLDESVIYLTKAIKLLPPFHQNDYIAYRYQALSNLAECFLKLNLPDSALYYSNLSDREALKMNKARGLALNKLNIGDAYQLQSKFKEAIDTYQKGLEYLVDTINRDVKLFLYTAMMQCASRIPDIPRARNYLQQALQIESLPDVNNYARISFLQQAIAFELLQNNYREASALQLKLNRLNEQNNRLEIEQRNNIIERYYENSKMLALANKDREIQASELRNKILINRFLFALLAVGILFTASLYVLYRQRNKLLTIEHNVALERLSHQKELEQQKLKNDTILEERNRIAKELHDDLGSLASSVHIMSGMLEKNLIEDERNAQLAAKIKRNSAQLSETLSDLVWAVYSKNDSFENMIHRMKNYAFEILPVQSIQVHFKYDYSIMDMSLGVVQRKNIFLIFKEAINNISKYSKADTVNIEFEKRENQMTLIISDNGIGFDINKNNRGNGINNLYARAKAIQGKIHLTSSEGKGTEIKLEWTV